MPTLPEWYQPYFPELRSGPPWVMEDMIQAEPSLARIVADLQAPAAELADAIRVACEEGGTVTVVGSGTAEHAAFGVADILDEAVRALGVRPGVVSARESFEASLDPPAAGLVIATSHGGLSVAAVWALEAARAAGLGAALITAAPGETPVSAVAEITMVTPLADASFCHTVGYLSPLLAAGAVGAALTGRAVNAPDLEAHLGGALGAGAQARRAAAALHGVDIHLATGSGTDMHAARELALKIEEGVRMASAMRGLETLMHGHFVAGDDTASLIAFVTDRRQRERRAERAALALQAARHLSIRTALVGTADVVEHVPAELVSAGAIVVPDDDTLPAALASLTASALALQLLTVGLVHEAGVNPDLIRREQDRYREVSHMTETKLR